MIRKSSAVRIGTGPRRERELGCREVGRFGRAATGEGIVQVRRDGGDDGACDGEGD
jgi:hypothetical protein